MSNKKNKNVEWHSEVLEYYFIRRSRPEVEEDWPLDPFDERIIAQARTVFLCAFGQRKGWNWMQSVDDVLHGKK